jgi:hypothetical protein
VCVISGCLIVMVVRGIRATCLLARYIGSALLQIVKFQHGNPKIRFFCNVNETDFDVFRGMAGGEQSPCVLFAVVDGPGMVSCC